MNLYTYYADLTRLNRIFVHKSIYIRMKTIIMRNVKPDISKIVESFKEEHEIKVNTDAVLKMIKDFPEMRQSYQEVFDKWKEEKERADTLNQAVENLIQCETAVLMAKTNLRGLLSKEFKKGLVS